jgi:hypothetical protein
VCGDTWVFDITEFLGYKVVLAKDKKTVKEYKLAFTATSYNRQIVFEKHIGVPAKILKETVNIIEKYEQEAFVKVE